MNIIPVTGGVKVTRYNGIHTFNTTATIHTASTTCNYARVILYAMGVSASTSPIEMVINSVRLVLTGSGATGISGQGAAAASVVQNVSQLVYQGEFYANPGETIALRIPNVGAGNWNYSLQVIEVY